MSEKLSNLTFKIPGLELHKTVLCASSLEHPGSFSGAFLMPLGVENGGEITQNRSKGRSGSENCIFFAKMRKCSKHCVLRVQIAVRRFQNRTKSVEEGQKWRRNQRECKRKTLAKNKHETERQKLGRRSNFVNLGDFRGRGPGTRTWPRRGSGP